MTEEIRQLRRDLQSLAERAKRLRGTSDGDVACYLDNAFCSIEKAISATADAVNIAAVEGMVR